MRRWKSRQLFFVWCALNMSPELLNLFLRVFVLFVFFRGIFIRHTGEGDFVLFSINQFSQPFNSEIYIHIADLLLSLLHPGTIYFFFFIFMSIPFPPTFMAIYWIGFLDVGAHPHTESFDNPVLSLSLYFTFFLSWQLFVCTLFSLFFLVHI